MRLFSAAVLRLIAATLFTLLTACSAQRVTPTQDVWDPIEPVNRGVFWFNDKFDVYLLEPVSRGYDTVMPQRVQDSVTNFFNNLRQPIDAANALLQAKMVQALSQTGRFLVNSTVGIAGFFDVASEIGLERKREDLGLTFAHWGLPPGPYIVLPFLGPSNLRDALGRGGDAFGNPVFYLGRATDWDSDTVFWTQAGLIALDTVNTRASMLDTVKSAKEAAFDYYLTMQGAYYQYRRGQYYDGNPPDEEDDEGAAGAFPK